ncbi:MAG TPA: hypothetical protein PKE39_08060 [Ignavibacteria bacterium]|nr:hypothetical protein [Ignavibacteria bacterium]HMQ98963.1 hypothetical protein [Ignavibacteria bacterium]
MLHKLDRNITNHRKILLISALVFSLFCAALLLISLYLNGWNFIYVIDDPYIHMAIAKNFVTSGSWAVNGQVFTSATSSPLWTLLISLSYFITGVNTVDPLVLNFVFSILSLAAAVHILKYFKAGKYIYYVIIVFIFSSPLPALVFTGMEHTAQIWLSLLFVFYASLYATGKNESAALLISLVIISMLLTALRYEDLFLVFSASVFFAARKKFLPAALIMIAGVIPPVLYGIISVDSGSMFLPSSILVKSRVGELSAIEILKIPYRALKRMLEPDIIFLLPPMVLVIYRNYKLRLKELDTKQVMAAIFILTYLLHMCFAQTGWFFRYEAYLVSMGIIILWVNIYPAYLKGANKENNFSAIKSRSPVFSRIILAAVILSVCGRAVSSFLVPQSSNNIYNQHFQMAAFVNTLPAGTTIAANDIGMLNFYTHNKIVDLWGLADNDAAAYKLNGNYTTSAIENITRQKGVELAIIYTDWFSQYGGVSNDWQMLGSWKMTRLNIVCGNERVSFYSLNKDLAPQYKTLLDKFSASLPASVLYTGY